MLIEQDKNRFKYIMKGLGTLFIYFFISIFQYVPFTLLHINISDISVRTLNMYDLMVEILMVFILYLIYYNEIKKAIKDIKQNHMNYFKKYFNAYIIGVIIMMLSNMLIGTYGGGVSENEATIRNAFELYPVYTFVAAVFLAPIIEEIVFRMGIKSIIKNEYLYIAVSGLIFGGLHLLGTPIDKLLPLYLLSYCSEGFAFAYMMSKTNNVLVSMGFHFMHNGIILSLQTFLLIFT